jgi:hypothetical protein
MTTETIKLEWAQPDERGQQREDACWYTFGHGHDLVVQVTRGERTVTVHADGEMRVVVYDDPTDLLAGQEIIRYAEDWAQHKINNDAEVFQASEAGRIEWVNNPWFDLYSEDGDHLDVVCHTLTEAIEKATKIINDDSDPLWEDMA